LTVFSIVRGAASICRDVPSRAVNSSDIALIGGISRLL